MGPTQIRREIADWLGQNQAPAKWTVLRYMAVLGYDMCRPGFQYSGDKIAAERGFKDCRAMFKYYRRKGNSWSKIARKIGVDKSTLHQWRERMGFK